MMNAKNIIFLAAIVILSAACKDEPVEIVTLSKAGNTFYFGEKVVVWTGVNGDANEIGYDWECTGGKFDGANTQHLRENLWIAPEEPGEYIVTVTAKTSTSSDSRQTKMKVVNYYTEGFDWGAANPGSWSSSNTTLAYGNSSIDASDKVVTIPATSNSSDANIRRTLTNLPLYPPFSIKTNMMYTMYKPVASNVTSGNVATFFSIYFVQPSGDLDKPYIREIRLEFCPTTTGTNNNWRLRMESYVPSLGRSTWTGATPVTVYTPGNLSPDGFQGKSPYFTFAKNQYHAFTFTVDADRKFSVYIDGQPWVENSNALNDYINTHVLTQFEMQVREFRITVPRNTGTATQTSWAITDVTINNDKTAIGGDINDIGFEDLK